MSGEHTHPEVAALDAVVAGLSDRLARLTAQVTTVEAGLAEQADRAAQLTQEVADMARWYDYSGKPAGTLVVPAGGYVRVDVDVADPPRSGIEIHSLYLNCALDWKTGGTDGTIRVRYVRENGDETAFQDFACNNRGAIGNPDRFLLTHTHVESGTAGVGGRWWVRCAGDLDSIKVSTRYCKIAVLT